MRIELRNPEPKFSLCISVSSGVAEQVDPGLIVIGAFGHSRTREMFFGRSREAQARLQLLLAFEEPPFERHRFIVGSFHPCGFASITEMLTSIIVSQHQPIRYRWHARCHANILTEIRGIAPFGLLAIASFDACRANRNDAMQKAVRLTSSFSYSDTVSKLESAFKSKRFTIFAVIDHQAAARSVALEMPPTTVLIYGDPRGGTPMMLAAPDFALELPLKVLVREGDNGKTYVTFNPSTTLEGRHGLPPGMVERFAPAEQLITSAIT